MSLVPANLQARIANEKLEQLVQRRDNALESLYKSGPSVDYQQGLPIVEEEIARRELNSPEEAMLSAVGYRVAASGPKVHLRRFILDRVLNGPLPQLPDKAEQKAWGEPGSLQRHRTAYLRIQYCLRRYGRQPNHEQANLRWKSDLEHIDQQAKALKAD